MWLVIYMLCFPLQTFLIPQSGTLAKSSNQVILLWKKLLSWILQEVELC